MRRFCLEHGLVTKGDQRHRCVQDNCQNPLKKQCQGCKRIFGYGNTSHVRRCQDLSPEQRGVCRLPTRDGGALAPLRPSIAELAGWYEYVKETSRRGLWNDSHRVCPLNAVMQFVYHSPALAEMLVPFRPELREMMDVLAPASLNLSQLYTNLDIDVDDKGLGDAPEVYSTLMAVCNAGQVTGIDVTEEFQCLSCHQVRTIPSRCDLAFVYAPDMVTSSAPLHQCYLQSWQEAEARDLQCPSCDHPGAQRTSSHVKLNELVIFQLKWHGEDAASVAKRNGLKDSDWFPEEFVHEGKGYQLQGLVCFLPPQGRDGTGHYVSYHRSSGALHCQDQHCLTMGMSRSIHHLLMGKERQCPYWVSSASWIRMDDEQVEAFGQWESVRYCLAEGRYSKELPVLVLYEGK